MDSMQIVLVDERATFIGGSLVQGTIHVKLRDSIRARCVLLQLGTFFLASSIVVLDDTFSWKSVHAMDRDGNAHWVSGGACLRGDGALD